MVVKERDAVLTCPALLVPFHLLCYANLKKYVFDHHFSFPALPSKWSLLQSKLADDETVQKVEKYISTAPAEQRGFFVITAEGTVRPLSTLSSHKTVFLLFVGLVNVGYAGIYIKLFLPTNGIPAATKPPHVSPSTLPPPQPSTSPLLPPQLSLPHSPPFIPDNASP